jgi:hypothetical protein
MFRPIAIIMKISIVTPVSTDGTSPKMGMLGSQLR